MRSIFVSLSLLVVLPLVAASVFASGEGEPDEDSLYKSLSIFTEVVSLARETYVDEPSLDSLMAGAMEGAADALGPFALYVPPGEVDSYLAAGDDGRALSGLLLLRDRGLVYVAGVDAGSPAESAGLERGDLVAKIDGGQTREVPLWRVRQTVAGPAGRAVELEIVRRNEVQEIELALGPWEVPAVELDRDGEVDVLRIRRFGEGTVASVAEALDALGRDAPRPLLVDLTGVAGLEAERGYAVAELFASGELGVLKSRDTVEATYSSAGAPAFAGTLGVMIDGGTLGAGEVLAAVLRDRVGAVLVGQDSFGHAGRVRRIELVSGGLLEVTDAFYTGPDGTPIDTGLSPEVRVTESSRHLADREAPMVELIERRAVEVLLDRDGAAALPEAA